MVLLGFSHKKRYFLLITAQLCGIMKKTFYLRTDDSKEKSKPSKQEIYIKHFITIGFMRISIFYRTAIIGNNTHKKEKGETMSEEHIVSPFSIM